MKQEQDDIFEGTFKDAELKRLDGLADILDNKFRIPGTDWRFGVDSLIGLVPYVGDIAGFAVSGYLLSVMVRKGAGIGIMLRMMGNTLLDALIGVIPFFGDIFDIGFKSNRRNVDLLKKYYADGKKKPSAKVSATVLSIVFLILLVFVMIGVWKIAAWLFALTWTALSGLM